MIFLSKIIENALATLRLILVANGKKLMGAILQFIITLVWALATGAVVVNIKKDPLKIIFFSLGSFIGSFIGSIIEEKMALGNNMLMVIINKEYEKSIVNELRTKGFAVTTMDGDEMNNKKKILMIFIARKKRHQIVQIIQQFDKSAMIVSEVARNIGKNQKNIF